MIIYDQENGLFLYKKTVSEVFVLFALIEIGAIGIILISVLLIFNSLASFGLNATFEILYQVFLAIGVLIVFFAFVIFYSRLKNSREVDLDFIRGRILTYKVNLFSEKKLLRENHLQDFNSVEMKVSSKDKQKLIVLHKSSSDLLFILGRFSPKNSDFDPIPLITDLKSFFSKHPSNTQSETNFSSSDNQTEFTDTPDVYLTESDNSEILRIPDELSQFFSETSMVLFVPQPKNIDVYKRYRGENDIRIIESHIQSLDRENSKSINDVIKESIITRKDMVKKIKNLIANFCISNSKDIIIMHKLLVIHTNTKFLQVLTLAKQFLEEDMYLQAIFCFQALVKYYGIPQSTWPTFGINVYLEIVTPGQLKSGIPMGKGLALVLTLVDYD